MKNIIFVTIFMECPGDVLFEILYFPGSLSCDLEAR